jgi:fimbrial chaperone protein
MRSRATYGYALLAAFCSVCGSAAASGLQVSPITLSLLASQVADGLWLSNAGHGALYAQVRVYHWTQPNGVEQLTLSRSLLVSPPMLQIQPNDEQLVRVIRVGPPPIGPQAVEDAYRISIDELPVTGAGVRSGLQFVLHYSLPIFVEPVSVTHLAPVLHWSLESDGEKAFLDVSNSGTEHAQLSAVTYVDAAGRRGDITPGLLGYVLPGATMRFALRQPAIDFAGNVTFEAMVNGSNLTQNVSLADIPR